MDTTKLTNQELQARILLLENENALLKEKQQSGSETFTKKSPLFSKLVTHAPYPVMVHASGEVIQLSNVWTHITGYTIDEIPTIDIWVEKAYGKDGGKIKDFIFKQYDTDVIRSNGEWEVKLKSGETRIWEFSTSPLGILPDGRKVVFSSAIDITEQKIAMEKAELNEIRLNRSEKIGRIGNYELDLATSEIFGSDQLFELYGRDPKLGFPSVDEVNKFYSEKDQLKLNQYIYQIIETGKPVEGFQVSIDLPKGEPMTLDSSMFPIHNSEGEVVKIYGVLQDVTEQKNTENELIRAKEKAEENEKRLNRSETIGKIGNWEYNLITSEIFWSDELFELYGRDMKLGAPTLDNIGDYYTDVEQEKLNNNILQIIETATPIEGYDSIVNLPNGKSIVLYSSMFPLLNEKNDVVKIYGVSQDITERKKAENDIIKAKEKAEESDRLKTEFINNMSHEIRTPMNGILGFSEFLHDENLSPQKRKLYVNIIQNSGNQLMKVVDDILEISKLGTKQVKTLEKQSCLNDLLLELFSVFDVKAKENSTPLYLKKGLSDIRSNILTDASKLNKILSNLLENALKYTNEGFIEFGYLLINNKIQIYVKDTGIGIVPEMHEKIFERFSQEEKELTKNVGGLGLGLSIAKENTELLGGEIELESVKGQGSMFTVTIPYKPVNSEPEAKTLTREPGHQFTVLIAEDEEVNYLYLETIIEGQSNVKYNIIHAKNGEEAVEECAHNPAIDIVLMDMKMPKMNGFEATRLIKKTRPNLPIIAQTAYSTIEDKEKAINVGCSDFISKPINRINLQEVVDKYMLKSENYSA